MEGDARGSLAKFWVKICTGEREKGKSRRKKEESEGRGVLSVPRSKYPKERGQHTYDASIRPDLP